MRRTSQLATNAKLQLADPILEHAGDDDSLKIMHLCSLEYQLQEQSWSVRLPILTDKRQVATRTGLTDDNPTQAEDECPIKSERPVGLNLYKRESTFWWWWYGMNGLP